MIRSLLSRILVLVVITATGACAFRPYPPTRVCATSATACSNPSDFRWAADAVSAIRR